MRPSRPADKDALDADQRRPALRSRPGLRVHLVGLVLAVLLPSLAVGAAAALQAARAYQGAAEGGLRDTARALALALDNEVATFQAAAIALASSPALRLAHVDDVPALRAWATEISQSLGSSAVIVNSAAPGHQQLLNTAVPEAAALPPPSRPGEGAWDLIRRVVETGTPAVSDLFTGRATNRPVMAVAAPVFSGGRVERVVVIALDPARLSSLLTAQGIRSDAFASVSDGQGRIVARSRDHDRFLGTVPASQRTPEAAARTGLFQSPTGYGYEGIHAREPLRRAKGWTVAVVEPVAAHRAAWLRPLLGLAAGGALALALGAAAAAVLARRLLAPVDALRRHAEAVASGHGSERLEAAGGTPAGVAEFELLRLGMARADAALQAREAEFRAFFEQSSVPMSQVDCATGHLLRVNAAYCALLCRADDQLVGYPFLDFVHPEDQAVDRQGFQRMCRGETAAHAVLKRYIRPDGSSRWVESASSPLRNATGPVVRSVAVLNDVTDRKHAEEALRASEQRLRLAQQAAEIGIYDWDIRSGAIRWSPEMFRLLGVDPATAPENLYGAWLQRLHPEDRDRAEQETKIFLQRDGQLQIEFRVLLPEGGVRWILGRGTVERDAQGTPLRMLGVNIDVTELREVEAALRKSEERLRLAQRAAGAVTWDWDLARGLIRWGDVDVARALASADFDEVTGFERWVAHIHPEDRARHDREAAAAIQAGEGRIEFRIRRSGGSGEVRWLEVSGRVIERDGRGEPLRMAGVTVDITARREAEAALRASESQLRLAVEAARLTTWEYDVLRDVGSRGGALSVEFPRLPISGFGRAAWFAAVHADDRPHVDAAFRAVAEGHSPRYDVTFRLEGRDGAGWRWIEAIGAPVEQDSATGRPLRLAGVSQDVTERKRAEQRQALLMRELDHRAKNLLAVVQAALRLTPRDNIVDFVKAVEGRVGALARTHTLLAEEHWKGAGLRQIVEGELAPFRSGIGTSQHVSTPQADLRGVDLTLAPAAAQAVSIALHELATNATKYGALSVPSGRVSVTWEVNREVDLLHLLWTETDGPSVEKQPERRGFGSRVIEATLREQLGGRVERRWETTGLVCEMALPLARIMAEPSIDAAAEGSSHVSMAAPHLTPAPPGS